MRKAPVKPPNKRSRSSAAEVRAYLASTPKQARSALRKLRAAIRSAAPSATETITYGIPTLKVDGRPLIYYAAWSAHTSIYPLTGPIRRAFATELRRYKTSKGTIRFPLDEPLPVAFIKRVVKARLAELRARDRS